MAVESAADRASFFADFGEVDTDLLPAMRWTSGVVTTRVAGHLHRGAVTIDVEDGPRVLNNRATFHCAVDALKREAKYRMALAKLENDAKRVIPAYRPEPSPPLPS